MDIQKSLNISLQSLPFHPGFQILIFLSFFAYTKYNQTLYLSSSQIILKMLFKIFKHYRENVEQIEGRGPCSLFKAPFSLFALCMYDDSSIILAVQESRISALSQLILWPVSIKCSARADAMMQSHTTNTPA